MSDLDNLAEFTRKQWLTCVLIAAGIFALNHWYFVSSGSFYPIVVWGAPLFFLVGIVGLIRPGAMRIPAIPIAAAAVGLATGLAAHHFLYGF